MIEDDEVGGGGGMIGKSAKSKRPRFIKGQNHPKLAKSKFSFLDSN